MTVLFFSDIPWSGLHQRPQHMAEAFARRWTVLWIQPTTLLKRTNVVPRQEAPNIYTLSIPVIPYNARLAWMRALARPLSYLRPFRAAVTRVQTALIRRALKRLPQGNGPLVAFMNNYQCIGVLDRLKTSFLLYDYIDNALGFVKLPQHVVDAWKKTVGKADVVTVTSPQLLKQLEPLRSSGIHLVGNGVEYAHFARPPQAAPPPEGVRKEKPVVCYAGAVYPWLDYALLQHAAEQLPGVQFLFLGPVHPQVQPAVARLKGAGNCSFLGLRPYAELPGYLQHASACMIPFQRNELTRSVDPVKLYEYCAAGKPTVATAFSEDLEPLGGTIFLARTKEEFVLQINNALARSHDPLFAERLRSFAREHDWSRKSSVIMKFIQEHYSP